MGEVATLEPPKAEASANGDVREPLDGEHPDEQPTGPAIPPLELAGKRAQLSLKIGGDAPEKATARIVGGKVTVPGEYDPGDVIECVVKLRCTKAGIIDKWDNNTGERTEREREHQFKILQIEKLPD